MPTTKQRAQTENPFRVVCSRHATELTHAGKQKALPCGLNYGTHSRGSFYNSRGNHFHYCSYRVCSTHHFSTFPLEEPLNRNKKKPERSNFAFLSFFFCFSTTSIYCFQSLLINFLAGFCFRFPRCGVRPAAAMNRRGKIAKKNQHNLKANT